MRKRSVKAPEVAPRVLVVTSIGPGKGYCLPMVNKVIEGMEGVGECLGLMDTRNFYGCKGESWTFTKAFRHWREWLPDYPAEATPTVYERLARMRESARRFFLEGVPGPRGGWWHYTHLYFHDCDIIPPTDIISRLLAHDTPVATGIYNRRNTNLPSPPLGGNWWEALCTDAAEHSLPSVPQMAVEGFGMGCMLIRRDVLEAIPFRAGEAGEDWAFAQDCRDRLGVATMLDPSLSCWHVSPDGTANRLKIEEKRTAVVWTDTPHYVTKREGGAFEKGVPRFDVAEHVIPTLGPGFVAVQIPGMSVQVKRAAEILAR